MLEPMYAFRLRLPQEAVGRALTDLTRLGAKAVLEEAELITGTGPVATLRGYAKEVTAYTKGKGFFATLPAGYMPCHNQDEVTAAAGYFPDSDLENPTGSVFCDHGGALYVNWDEVDEMAHLEPEVYVDSNGKVRAAADTEKAAESENYRSSMHGRGSGAAVSAGNDELEAIFLRTYGKSKRDEAIRRANMSRQTQKTASTPARTTIAAASHRTEQEEPKKPLWVIDGYNVIFAWEELSELAKLNIDSAREALIDTVGNYMGYRNIDAVIVFDGYRLSGNPGEKTTYEKANAKSGELQVVYTREAQTADRFIEKTVYEFGRKRRITVVTSDRPVQMAALGDGAARMSAREFYAEVRETNADIRLKLSQQQKERNLPFAELTDAENR